MARCGVSLLVLAGVAALAALAAASPVRPPASSPAARSPLHRLDNWTRSRAPDMADPLPPAVHAARAKGPRVHAAGGDPYRLPTNVVPLVYQVQLTPDFTDFTFAGNALIVIRSFEATSEIVLHAKELVLSVDTLVVIDERLNEYYAYADDIKYDKEHDFATIKLTTPLAAGGRYRVVIDFTGVLNDDLDGFYRSSYKTSNGETRWLATTQFESTGARRAFPCWDEPSLKARFYIIIDIVDDSRDAISNMPVISKKNDGEQTKVQFDGTLPISPYLIAFIVSDFTSLTNEDGNFTVWARKDLIQGGQFSQDVGQKALELLGDYTGIPYALPKEDQAAIPDFAAGAMENWGLVTYREEYLIEQDTQPIRIRQFMATTVCHELGHQWTGDLVTLDWWAHTWLNEGFADYFENYICSLIKPDWHLRDQGIVGDHHRGMELDAIEEMHAMSSPTSTPDDNSEKFDRISYSKGGAVIRMWEHFLGLDVLKKGMHRYLSINMFKNTNPEHLFKAIDFEAQKANVLPEGLTFNEIARTWTEQPGVPVVSAARDYNANTIKLSQQRFFYAPPNRAALLNQRWHIPITIVEQPNADWDNLKPTTWLHPGHEVNTQTLTKASSSQWVLVNPKEIGYYRVNYDLKNWNLLAKQLSTDPTKIAAASRAQLINDALSLARGQQLDYAVAMQFLSYLTAERSATPWQSAVTAIDFLRNHLVGTDAWNNFQAFVNKVTTPTYQAVGFAGSQDHEARLLRYYSVSYACYAGNADCIKQANDQLKSWVASGGTAKLDPDTKKVTLCSGLHGADAASSFDFLKTKWMAEKDREKRDDILDALVCAKEEQFVGFFTDAINNKIVGLTEDDVVNMFAAALNRPEQVGVLFNFAKKNYKQIDAFFAAGPTNNGAVGLLNLCIEAITSTEQLYDARMWVENNYKGQSGYDTLQKAFLEAYINQEWYRSNYKAVADWLATA